jgi:hypothetical protein
MSEASLPRCDVCGRVEYDCACEGDDTIGRCEALENQDSNSTSKGSTQRCRRIATRQRSGDRVVCDVHDRLVWIRYCDC